MEYRVEESTGKRIINVSGELKTIDAPEFSRVILQSITPDKPTLLDLNGLEFMCSGGLRALLAGQQKADDEECDFQLCNVGKEVMDVLRMTGFVNVLTIQEA